MCMCNSSARLRQQVLQKLDAVVQQMKTKLKVMQSLIYLNGQLLVIQQFSTKEENLNVDRVHRLYQNTKELSLLFNGKQPIFHLQMEDFLTILPLQSDCTFAFTKEGVVDDFVAFDSSISQYIQSINVIIDEYDKID